MSAHSVYYHGCVQLVLLLVLCSTVSVSQVLAFSHPRPLLLHNPNVVRSSAPLLQHPFSDADDEFLKLDEQALGLLNTNSSANAGSGTVKASSSCEPSYGVLPCSETVIGNIFLLAAYGYLLYLAASYMSEGSELLLTVLDPGIIGGLLLPILGALPDSLLILVSGLGGTTAEAQEQVLVGIGLLAGSIVMLQTLLWGSCLLLGRCDLERDERGKLSAKDKILTRPCDLVGTGVENDELTKLSARIMTLSIIPFIIPQFPSIFNFSATGNICVLVACILAFVGLIAYCVYQILSPWVQERRKEIALKMVIKATAMERLIRKINVERKSLVDSNGNLNKDLAQRLFHAIDKNSDGKVQKSELALMLSTTMVNEHVDTSMVDHLMAEYDVNKDDEISREEFLKGMEKWAKELNLHRNPDIGAIREQAQDYINGLIQADIEEEEDEEESTPPSKSQIIRKAVLYLLAGTAVAAIFADPLVDAVNDFSTATSIPSFFISFVLLPIASTSSEGVSSILFSARKKKKNMSLTYSQFAGRIMKGNALVSTVTALMAMPSIYGGVTMNNTMGLGIFLAVVYFRQLVWDFSSEVLVVCFTTIVMGLLASFRTVFPTWMAGIALLLYPLSLGLVAVLDYVFGWE